MKAPPKRKGNNRLTALEIKNAQSRLNESPSEKEGKYGPVSLSLTAGAPQ